MIGERIKYIRKHFNITQQEFADKLQVKRNTIAQYEIGRNEPQSTVIALICNTYNVNRHWLETGEGEMFNSLEREKEIAMFFRKVSKHPDTELDQFRQNLVIALAKLDESEWEVIAGIAAKLASQNEKNGE